MGTPRTLGSVTIVPGKPTPALLAAAGYTPAPIAAISFSILKGIATVVLGSANLPKNGYNGPNGYPTQNGTTGSKFDIQGKWPAANGQQVVLWGFTTATYFNGLVISVLDCNPSTGSFRFYINNADVASTADAGNTAAIPFQAYRVLRIEAGQANGATDLVYVGDGKVSSTRYITALTGPGAFVEIASDNIRADRIFLDGTSGSDTCQISVIY